jgi:hypothetical protein
MHRLRPQETVRFALTALTAWLLVDDLRAAEPRLNARVLAFAKSKMDQKVGNGQCWTLAYAALKSAGARLPGVDGYGTYVFGRGLPLDRIAPGDVVQFEKVRFKETRPDGSWLSFTFPHHTAIVYAVKGRTVTFIHQNVNDVKRVRLNTFNLDALKGGSLKVYRPQPR